jgi:hypothetical protein
METYDIWHEVLWKIESRPLENWVERIVEQVRASKLEAAQQDALSAVAAANAGARSADGTGKDNTLGEQDRFKLV